MVLLVENDTTLAGATAELLRHRGYTVRLASTGEGGLAAIRERIPRVLVLDLMLPGANGQALLYEARRLPDFGRCKVIVTTAFPDPPGLPPGVTLLEKPFAIETLVQAIERAAPLEGGG